jgi:ubiquinone/menaquinone biosynthesis C-methylase UbiE
MIDLNTILRCPKCKLSNINYDKLRIECKSCNSLYPVKNNAACLIDNSNKTSDQQKMMNWWDDLCMQWYTDYDKNLTAKKLYSVLPELEESFKTEEHLIFNLDLNTIKNKSILHIGCGGGAADCIMRKYEANVISIDISGQRAASTGLKHSLMEEGFGFAAQANAENLPFEDNSFDIVYSNGVWMHSESYKNIAEEAYRVLKPGGKLVIMLYARYSSQYLIHLLYDGILKGYLWKYGRKYWLGAATEGKPLHNSTMNPFTAAFTFLEVEDLLSSFAEIRMKKVGATLNEIPFFGRRLKKFFMRYRQTTLYHDAGIMRVGEPIYAGYLPIEKKLEKYMGWNIDITATKPK